MDKQWGTQKTAETFEAHDIKPCRCLNKRKGRSPVTRGEKNNTSQSCSIEIEPTAPGLPQALVCILSQRERGRIFFTG